MARGLCLVGLAGTATAQLNALPHTTWPSSDPQLDCKLRQLAFEYAEDLDITDQRGLQDISDALQLQSCVNMTSRRRQPTSGNRQQQQANNSRASAATAFYVSADGGSDTNPGTRQQPFRTVQRAAQAAAADRSGEVDVLLRGGTHVLQQTLELGPQHSGTTFASFPNESATVSGGLDLSQLRWRPAADFPSGSGVVVADVPPGSSFMELFDGEVRLTRARYPNGRQTAGAVYPRGWARGVWHGAESGPANSSVGVQNTVRTACPPPCRATHASPTVVRFFLAFAPSQDCRATDYDLYGWFACQNLIVGGPGARFSPPVMTDDSIDLSGSRPTALTMRTPSKRSWARPELAVVHGLPLQGVGSGSGSGGERQKQKQKPARRPRQRPAPTPTPTPTAADSSGGGDDDGGEVDMFPSWAGYMARVASRSGAELTFETDLTRKGFWQDQAGAIDDGQPAAFFVENVKEELDAPDEWYLDEERAQVMVCCDPSLGGQCEPFAALGLEVAC